MLLTDIGPCLDLLRRNVSLNASALTTRGGSARVVELYWSASAALPDYVLDAGPFDFVLVRCTSDSSFIYKIMLFFTHQATDCLLPYDPNLLVALAGTLERLSVVAAAPLATLVTFEERFDVAPFFDECARRGLAAHAVPQSAFDATFRDNAIQMVRMSGVE